MMDEEASSEMLSRLSDSERELLTFRTDGIAGKDSVSKFINGAYRGDMEVVQFYILQGYSANLQDANGNTPLMAAAYNGHMGVIKYLLSHGADINFQNNNGVTALMYALAQKRIEVLQYMMAFEPDLELTNSMGLKAVDIARKMGYKEAIRLLDSGRF